MVVSRRSSFDRSTSIRAFVALVLLGLMMAPHYVAPPATMAAKGPECDWFTFQDEAQATLDRTAESYPDLLPQWSANLDPDGNGIACDQLPARPDVLIDTQSILGRFEDNEDSFMVTGVGYSARYNLTLAGVAFTDDCPQLDEDLLSSLVQPPDKQATTFFISSTTAKPIPPDDKDGTYAVVGVAWFIAGDPSTPILANEWLLQAGLAKLDAKTAPADYVDRLKAAEASAQEAGLGVWGSCDFSATAIGAETTTAYSHVLRESGDGDQIVQFTIETEGTYQLTIDAMGGSVVFVAVDLYATDSTWFPEFSIITSSSGAFSSAGYLYPGTYYVQIKAVGGWRITLDAM